MPLIGNEILEVQGLDVTGRPAATTQRTTTGAIAALVVPIGALFTAVAGNTPLQLTGAQVGGASDVVVNLTATLAGAGTVTLPTVAQLVAAIPNAFVGMSYNLRIMNSSGGAFAWTVTTNTGWTLTGTMTIAQTTYRDFIVTLNSLTAATLQQVGTGPAT